MRTNVSNTCISHAFLDFFSVKIAVSQFHVPSLFSQVGARCRIATSAKTRAWLTRCASR